jgi:hypothetical protein
MAIPSQAQVASAARGSKEDMHNTLTLLRNQMAQHISQIESLTTQVSNLQKQVGAKK